MLILGQAQALPQLLLHGVAYEQLARRGPVTREPRLAHPSGHGYLQGGEHPVRQGAWVDIATRVLLANTTAPIPLEICRVVDLGADVDTTMDTQPTPSYGIRPVDTHPTTSDRQREWFGYPSPPAISEGDKATLRRRAEDEQARRHTGAEAPPL